MDVLAIGYYPKEKLILIGLKDGTKLKYVRKPSDKPCKDMMEALHTNFGDGESIAIFEKV